MLRKASVLLVLLGALFSGSASAYDVQLGPFKDEENDYAKESIYTLSALGIVNGYEDRTFRPNEPLSREAFVKLLVSANRLNPGKDQGGLPADVAARRWSAPYIAVAYERQWIDSLLDKKGLFHPSQTITRQEVALLAGTTLLDAETEEVRSQWLKADWKKERDRRAFKDRSSIAASLQPYVYYATYRGIMEGDAAGFMPKEPLIRKQAAAVIYRMIDKQVSAEKLRFTGFYAIQSYSALSQMSKLSDVVLGWSHLEYGEAGKASLNTTATVHRMPSGYEEVLGAADAAGIPKELMVFYDGSNLRDFLKDGPAQAAFLSELLAALRNPADSFSGVTIDFEGLKEAASAADYVGFLRDLKAQLGEFTLSVAVPPVDYYKGYELREIGKLADTVILMAYDYTHNESKLPSAPLPLVNDAVVTALESIPKEKLVLGISKQANQWITVSGVTGNALNPAVADVEKRLGMPGVAKTFEMPYFLTKAVFTDERGSHEIYYEDKSSIAKKLWLAKFYGLKGVSLWFMGNFTAEDWKLVGEQSTRN